MNRRHSPPPDPQDASTGETTRVLMAEDSDRDAELVLRALKRSGLKFESRRVQTEPEFRRALNEFDPEIILSDFDMPGFGGVAALRICRELGIDIPFIFVSGTIGEDVAVEAMKAGADDYVMKTNLIRLGPTVQRTLREAEVRRGRRIAEAALQESELRHRVMFENAAVGIAHTSMDGRVMIANPKYCEITGYTRDEILALTIVDLTHPGDIEARVELRSRMVAGTIATYERETRLVHKDRSLVWTNVTASLVRSADGRPQYFISVLQDISERKRIEQAARDSESKFRSIFENTVEGIYRVSIDGRLTACNPAFARLHGYDTPEEAIASIPDVGRLYVDPDDRKKLLAVLQVKGQVHGFESRAFRKDGSVVWMSLSVRQIRDEAGGAPHVLGMVQDITERKRAEEALRDAEQRYRSIFENTLEGIFESTSEGRYLSCNPAAARILGYESERDLISSVTDIGSQVYVRFDDRRKVIALLESEGYVHGFETEFYRKDRQKIWIAFSVQRVVDKDGGSHFLGLMQDVTDRRAQQRRIERLTRVYAVLSGINSLIVRVKDRDELFRGACRIAVEAGGFRLAWAGLVDRAAAKVQPIAWRGAGEGYIELMPLNLGDNGAEASGLVTHAVANRKAMISDDMTQDPRIMLKKEAFERGLHSLAVLPLLADGEAVGILALYASEIGFFDAEEMRLLTELAGDISFALDHIEKAGRLDYLAYFDQLTGLANRNLFVERLDQYVQGAGPTGGKVALVLVDVERLRMINESLGRRAGDALLVQVAKRLALGADPAEIARIGADQFAVVLREVKGRSEVVRRISKLWHGLLGEPFEADGTELRIAMKAGVALFPHDGADAGTLLRNSEAALRVAKKTGERHVFHVREMTAQAAVNLTLENRLRQALEKEEFVLHYQPKVELEAQRIVGVEALIRWQSPELGLVPPMKFIPLLEETGLILEVGSWALQRAAADHRGWVEQGLQAPRIAVNVSAIQLRQRDFVGAVERAIVGGVAPTAIDLEITESLVMEDIEGNIRKLKEVRALGLSLAIDDFGTGYSSLAYLAKLPVQTLKIDRSFIIAMLDDADTMTLVQTIISLAHSLRLGVVAEGVETEEQAKMLRLLRCDQMQGYLFSRPVPVGALTSLLRENQSR